MGTRSRPCRPKVRGRFAFPGARNPRICSIWCFGKIFPAIFPGLSRSFLQEPPNRPRKQPQPSRVFWTMRLHKHYLTKIVLRCQHAQQYFAFRSRISLHDLFSICFQIAVAHKEITYINSVLRIVLSFARAQLQLHSKFSWQMFSCASVSHVQKHRKHT